MNLIYYNFFVFLRLHSTMKVKAFTDSIFVPFCVRKKRTIYSVSTEHVQPKRMIESNHFPLNDTKSFCCILHHRFSQTVLALFKHADVKQLLFLQTFTILNPASWDVKKAFSAFISPETMKQIQTFVEFNSE